MLHAGFIGSFYFENPEALLIPAWFCSCVQGLAVTLPHHSQWGKARVWWVIDD